MEKDEVTLTKLVEKVGIASDAILARLRVSPEYRQLKPRQQARMYVGIVGEGPAAVLLQLARLGKLDPDAARKVVRNPSRISAISQQVERLCT